MSEAEKGSFSDVLADADNVQLPTAIQNEHDSTQSEPTKRSSVEDSQATHTGEANDWDSDPDNARNWSGRRKWKNVFVVVSFLITVYDVSESSGLHVHIRSTTC